MLFKSVHVRLFGALLGAAVLLSACNSSNDGGAAAPSLTGVAATGAPISGATVTATGANNQTATTTTNADGTYTISNLSALTFPIQITVTFPRGGELLTLRSLAVAAATAGATRANITPLTDVIAANAQSVPAADLPALITRITGILSAALQNFNLPSGVDFLAGNFTANPSDPIDNALDLVSVSFQGTTLTVTSNVDPSQSSTVTIDSNTTAEDVSPVAAPVSTASASPSDIKALVDAFATVLKKGSAVTSADFDSIFHSDYMDDEGLDQVGFAELVVEDAQAGIPLTVQGYRILRCYEDSGSVSDKCLIRVNVITPVLADEDFGSTQADRASVKASDFFDYIVERRPAVSGLRISGSAFKPFSTRVNLLLSNSQEVLTNGATNENSSISTLLSIFSRVAIPGATATEPEDLANINLQSVSVVRNFGQVGESSVMSVFRSANAGECPGQNNRLNVAPASGICSNQSIINNPSTLIQDSIDGLLSAVFVETGDVETATPMLRIGPVGGGALAKFGSIDQEGLANLVAYNQTLSPAESTTVTLTLVKPTGAVNVCLSDGGVNEDICVYATRKITIPGTRLGRNRLNYFVITRDAENNTYQRTYVVAALVVN